MPQGIESNEQGEGTTTNEVGEVATPEVTADNYIPADGESASETARNIADLLKAEDDSGDQGEGQQAEAQSQERDAQGNKADEVKAEDAQDGKRARDETGKFVKPVKEVTKKLDKANDPELQPPQILDAAGKKAFLNLPEGLKREAHRMFRSIQATGTRTQQALTESLKRSERVINQSESYLRDNPIADENGVLYTPERFNTELIRAHHNLNRDKERTLAGMIIQLKPDLNAVNAYLEGKSPTGIDISKDPTVRDLQNTVQELKTKLGEREQLEFSARQAPLAHEFSQVMQEIDPSSGEYRYPELHEKAFSDSTKPIVAALLRTGRYTPGEALKEAYFSLTGIRHSQNGNQPIFPTKQPVNYNERARQAAVSVRGRIAPDGGGANNSADLELHEIPQSATETARLVLQRLTAGG